jgi:hypothetical protein
VPKTLLTLVLNSVINYLIVLIVKIPKGIKAKSAEALKTRDEKIIIENL